LRLSFIRNYQSTKAPDNGSNLIDEKFFERSFRLKTIPKSIYLEMICADSLAGAALEEGPSPSQFTEESR